MYQQKAFHSKAQVEDQEQGIVHAVVSCFGNVDSDGDVVDKGAFASSIKAAMSSGRFPPGVWHHDWKQPVARTLSAEEKDDGLHVVGQFNLETQRGRETFSDIKAEIITQYSFGFDGAVREKAADGNHIKSLEWHEWSPVLVGSNRQTRTVGVKSRYLGDYTEQGMTMAAIERAWYALCSALYQALDRGDANLDPLFDEFRDLSVRVIAAIAAGSGKEDAAAAKERLRALQTKAAPLAGLSLDDHLSAALGAVDDVTTRAGAVLDLRTGEGKAFSAARLAQARDLKEALASFVARAEQPTAEDEAAGLYAQFLATEARLCGVPV